MDQARFDALSQSVARLFERPAVSRETASRTYPRRLVLGGFAGAALSVLFGADVGRAKGKNKKKKKKGGGGGKPKPQPGTCKDDSKCGPCQFCDSNKCAKHPARENFQCGECGVCRDGRCVPDPRQVDQPCFNGSCKRCKADGTCGPPNNDNCEDGQICRPSDGRCAIPCLENGASCPPHHICISDGPLGAPNTCCLVKNEPGQQPTNFGCGDNGDDTFRQCCSALTERCCEDSLGPRCVPNEFCCLGELPCNGACCPAGQKCINGECTVVCPDGRLKCNGVCCTEDEVCNIEETCENFRVCPRESCSSVGLQCCPPNSHTTAAYCCNPTDVCIDTEAGCCRAPCSGLESLHRGGSVGRERRRRSGRSWRRRARG